ncbi:MAG: hypothetical protein LKJ86_02930 [Oscillibacter sp.]|jgi:hypothetical protein|nr:hypothetical protein [Oscillibacter sp.]
MKKNRWLLRAAALLLVSLSLNVTLSAAAEAGSSGDPLVTLSYLNTTYLNTILTKVDSKITTRNADLIAKIGSGTGSTSAGTTFTVVTLKSGQTLTGEIGCEVMLRVGTATCVAASSPGLIDETTGAALAGGKALTQNHLYMMTVENRGVKATAATVKVLARGTYSIA